MRKLVLAAIAAASVASLAHAEGGSAAASYTSAAATASSVQIQAVANNRYHMQPDEFRPIAGTYHLADGHTLRVSAFGRKMYAEIDHQGQAELVATSATTLIGRDANLRLSFDGLDQGRDSDVVVTGNEG